MPEIIKIAHERETQKKRKKKDKDRKEQAPDRYFKYGE